MTPRPPSSTLFPYTTLFRSLLRGRCRHCREPISVQYPLVEAAVGAIWILAVLQYGLATRAVAAARSEEHTSELQSHHDLVCRLLLEKKKKQTTHSLSNLLVT